MTQLATRFAALGFLFLTLTLTPFAAASESDKKTLITTHQPLQLQGKFLEPGQYVMKLLASPSDRSILQLFDATETKLEKTSRATSADRLEPTGDTWLPSLKCHSDKREPRVPGSIEERTVA
jgi:hypothetical protein